MSQSVDIISLSRDDNNDSEEFDIQIEQGWTEESISSSDVDESIHWCSENESADSIASNDNSQDEELIEKTREEVDEWIRNLLLGKNRLYESIFKTVQFHGLHYSNNTFLIKYPQLLVLIKELLKEKLI